MRGELAYFAAVAAGAVLGALATWLLPARDDPVPALIRPRLRAAAQVGGVLGAYLLELPADWLGWSAPASRGLSPIGGRTILGGLLGGWLAVELAKKRAGFRGATGDRFAVPLAIAMACGRVGCTLRGCCEGILLDPASALARVGLAFHGEPRFPAALVESWFHAAAACGLVLLAVRDAARGARLAIYVALYALTRFALERVRDHPRVVAGLTYYQLLAVVLFALGAATAWRRLAFKEPACVADVG